MRMSGGTASVRGRTLAAYVSNCLSLNRSNACGGGWGTKSGPKAPSDDSPRELRRVAPGSINESLRAASPTAAAPPRFSRR